MATVDGVPARGPAIKAATTHTSPTFLKSLVGYIAGLKDAQRRVVGRLRDLGAQLRELERQPAGEAGVAEDVRKLRQEIRDLEARRRADKALLAHKEEQLDAIRKGQPPEVVDGDARRRAEAEAGRGSPVARLRAPDLSSLNET